MKTNHTPTPWKQEGRRVKGGEYQTETFDVSLSGKSSNVRMATAHRVNFSCFHEEDSAFIVRAVNSHEALIAGIQAAIIHVNNDQVKKMLANILAKAKEGL